MAKVGVPRGRHLIKQLLGSSVQSLARGPKSSCAACKYICQHLPCPSLKPHRPGELTPPRQTNHSIKNHLLSRLWLAFRANNEKPESDSESPAWATSNGKTPESACSQDRTVPY
eukprot:3033247-Amphidinium_carterae.2